MADNVFQLPRSSYEEIVKILRAYNSAGVNASLEDISKRATMPATSVSMNNKFLISANLLEGGNKKSLTELGTNLGKALEYEMPDQIKAAWKKIVSSSDFFEKVITAVRIRRGMEPSALRTHIAYTAGEAKNAKVMTGAKTIIDILIASGSISEVDGKYLVISENKKINDSDEIVVTEEVNSQSEKETQNQPFMEIKTNIDKKFNININIELKCDMNELDFLGLKLKKIMEDLENASNSIKE